MKIAIYPGSFAPLHRGHIDIIEKALTVFDKVIVARGRSDKKHIDQYPIDNIKKILTERYKDVIVTEFDGFLKDFVSSTGAMAIVKGLRNASDLDNEKIQQYVNEDLGIGVQTVFFIADRGLTHISSSVLRGIKEIENSKLRIDDNKPEV